MNMQEKKLKEVAMNKDPNTRYDLSFKFSPEIRLMLLLLSQVNEKKSVLTLPNEFSDINWNRFLQLSRKHCVGPLINRAIPQGKSPILPETIRKTLAAEHKTNIFVSMNLSDALCRLGTSV